MGLINLNREAVPQYIACSISDVTEPSACNISRVVISHGDEAAVGMYDTVNGLDMYRNDIIHCIETLLDDITYDLLTYRAIIADVTMSIYRYDNERLRESVTSVRVDTLDLVINLQREV